MNVLFSNISTQSVILQTDDVRGKGKTAATNAAASLLCLQPLGLGEFCGVCPACRKVLKGIHPDVLYYPRHEKYFSVKEADSVVFETQKAKIESERRVFIIDTTAVINSQQAVVWQNKMLKVLEEAPSGNFYFLLCGAASELLQTVVSRCQVFNDGDMPGAGGRDESRVLEPYSQNAQKILPLALRILNTVSAADALRASSEIIKSKEGVIQLLSLVAALARDAAAHNAFVTGEPPLILPEYAVESQRLSREMPAAIGAEIIRTCETAVGKLRQNANLAAVTDELLMKITEVKHKCPK